MGVAYAEVEYEIAGRRYHTVHGFWSDISSAINTFTAADYNVWGGEYVGDADFENATDPANNEVDPRTLIEAVLFFHRAMQSPAVILRNLSINDGPTPGDQTGNFVSLNLDLQCRGNDTVNSATLGGLNNAMLITKQPQGFSKRKGHMWLRGAIAHTHMIFGDADGVTFQPGLRAVYALQMAEAALGQGVGVTTRLFRYFGDGVSTDSGAYGYCIPRTQKVTGIDQETGEPVTKRILMGWTNVDLFNVTDVQSRDTRRRKKKAA